MTRIPSSKTGNGRVQIKDEGMVLSELAKMNFIGAGVTASVNGDTANITIPGGGSDYVWPGFEAFDTGSSLGFAEELEVTGDGVVASFANGRLTLDIAAGTGGGTTPAVDANYETMFNPKNVTYGAQGSADTTGGDTAKIQACLNDACNNLPAVVVIPADTYYISTDILAPSASDFQVPNISSANTTTDVITFNQEHKKKTGDPIMFQGHLPGGMAVDTIYFVNVQSTTTMKLYDTRANAVAGGAGGLVNITSDVRTTGSITNGTASLAVASELGCQLGDRVDIAGVTNSNGSYYVIGGVGTGTLTLNANANATVSSATVTFVGNIDWRYYPSGLKIVFQPGAKFKKTASFSGNALLNISLGSGVEIRGGMFEGNTTALNSGINAGDDLLRVSSSHRVLIEQCLFMHCGDSAIRVQTATRDPQAHSTSNPEGGVNSGEVVVRNNYFYNIHQFSSTTNDFVHGGTANLWFYGNTMDNLRGSIKVASRNPGGRNMFMFGNTFKSGLDKGFEIDSTENIYIWDNTFRNLAGYAIYILSNNGPANSGFGTGIVGFTYATAHIHNNIFDNSGSAGGTIRFQPDLYSDGTLFDYVQLDITNNTFKNVAGTSNLGLFLNGGSYKQLNFSNNKFFNFAGYPVRANVRGSTTSGFVNNWNFENNQIEMSNASAIGIDLRRTTGTEKLNVITLKNNKISGTCAFGFIAGDCKNITYEGNQMHLTAGQGFVTATNLSLENLVVKNNICRTGGTVGWQIGRATGVVCEQNITEVASGTNIQIENTCSNVWFKDNMIAGAGTHSVGQVPINSKGIGKTGRREDGTATPTVGTWRQGDIIDFTNVNAGGVLGKYCVTNGTMGTITATTGSITNGDDELTVSTVAGLAVGCYISIAGVTGTKKVLSISGLVVTLDSTADATVSGAAVAYVAATFKDLPAIAA